MYLFNPNPTFILREKFYSLYQLNNFKNDEMLTVASKRNNQRMIEFSILNFFAHHLSSSLEILELLSHFK